MSRCSQQRHICLILSRLLMLNFILILFVEALSLSVHAASKLDDKYANNEFAEFEEFDEDDETPSHARSASNDHRQDFNTDSAYDNGASSDLPTDNSDGVTIVEDAIESYEDENLSDSEEFENSETIKTAEKRSSSQNTFDKGRDELKITSVPLHLRSSWESYYLEFLMIGGLMGYFLNFLIGRSKNQRVADAWMKVHSDFLESNFTLIGDDGRKDLLSNGSGGTHTMIKETENLFTLWCSGRSYIEGMLVELKLIKRQDLVSTISRLVKPAIDQKFVKLYLTPDTMDSYVFCIAQKKTAVKLAKEMNDLSTYCPERKLPDRYGINGDVFFIMNEIGEVASVLLDSKVAALFKKFEKVIDYIHISDQYSGAKTTEDSQVSKLPEVRRVIACGFNYTTDEHAIETSIENLKSLMFLIFYLLERVKRFRLSKEAKTKSDKNRQRVEEIFLKATHAQRQEAAQVKREERRRAEKERMLNEDDPDKQRKWEEREHRRELKRKTPRMKQLKVKAM